MKLLVLRISHQRAACLGTSAAACSAILAIVMVMPLAMDRAPIADISAQFTDSAAEFAFAGQPMGANQADVLALTATIRAFRIPPELLANHRMKAALAIHRALQASIDTG